MEYQFYHSERGPVAEVSMEQAPFGRWLSDEIGNDFDRLQSLLANIEQLRAGVIDSLEISGKEFRLSLDRYEADLKANSLIDQFDSDSEQQMQEEGLSFYDSEECAGCGLEDFDDLLNAWLDFIR